MVPLLIIMSLYSLVDNYKVHTFKKLHDSYSIYNRKYDCILEAKSEFDIFPIYKIKASFT